MLYFLVGVLVTAGFWCGVMVSCVLQLPKAFARRVCKIYVRWRAVRG